MKRSNFVAWNTFFYFHQIYNHGKSVGDKLWFSCQIAQYRKALISIFQQFSGNIKSILGLGGHWALGYNSMKF